ncbi:MAG: MFS transporter, partial [candidate division Zixibacteria bacterium]|nr:MFS transporter [candidate division Zixibacteria bacterium]
GRRKLVIIFSLFMSLAGVLFYLTENYLLLIIAAFIGTVNVTGNEVGSFLSIEQAILPQTCTAEKRNFAFAVYNMLGTLAASIGVLIAGFPQYLQNIFNLDKVASVKMLFPLYSLLGIISALIVSRMSKKVESNSAYGPAKSVYRVFSPASQRNILKLSLLFGIDSFAGGFIIQSILSYWFFVKFGVDFAQLSQIFFGAGVLTALSYLTASGLAKRFGLINTMVFSHIPSNILLILVPLAPSLPVAVGLLLARMSISQMDVPTRQSYVVAIVNPEERVPAAGITAMARNTAQAISPSFAGYILQFFSLSAPFFIAGSLKIVYDIMLYLNFRKLKAPEER